MLTGFRIDTLVVRVARRQRDVLDQRVVRIARIDLAGGDAVELLVLPHGPESGGAVGKRRRTEDDLRHARLALLDQARHQRRDGCSQGDSSSARKDKPIVLHGSAPLLFVMRDWNGRPRCATDPTERSCAGLRP
jgi:hypothetical protein